MARFAPFIKPRPLSALLWTAAVAAAVAGCSPGAAAQVRIVIPPSAPPDLGTTPWARDTLSGTIATPGESPCAERDPRLDALALELARGSSEPAAMSPEAFVFVLRRSGSPYVWPEMMSLVTQPAAPEHAERRVSEWTSGLAGLDGRANGDGGAPTGNPVRCGVATAAIVGGARTVGIATVPLAELSTLPTEVHTGRWLVVRGSLHPGTTAPQVVVMGPRGRPRALTTASDQGRFRATFAADQPGRWVVQVMATAAGGPRPVLEAWVYAGVPPTDDPESQAVPGEAAGDGGGGAATLDDVTRVRQMLQAARRAEGVGQLRRSAHLDALAMEHAETMLTRGRVAHDAGRGDAAERMRVADVQFLKLGENVARATSPEAVHRALWASPAHRATMLDPGFREFGVAAVRSPDGTIWVCQLFATLVQ